MNSLIFRASCKSHILRHSGESRNPEFFLTSWIPGRASLARNDDFSCFREFSKDLSILRFLAPERVLAMRKKRSQKDIPWAILITGQDYMTILAYRKDIS
jgi:hypothetical protein